MKHGGGRVEAVYTSRGAVGRVQMIINKTINEMKWKCREKPCFCNTDGLDLEFG